eukprot:PhF_6_TR1524/c0_g1_i1/m.2781
MSRRGGGQRGGNNNGGNEGGNHTLILIQPSNNVGSRTYLQESSLPDTLEAVLKHYEVVQSRGNQRVQYSADALLQWVDQQYDMNALVYDPQRDAYVAFPRAWLKEKLVAHLNRGVAY